MSILEDWQPATELLGRVDALLAESDERMRSDPEAFVRDHYRRLGAALAVHARALGDAIKAGGEGLVARLATLDSGAQTLMVRDEPDGGVA